MKCLEKKLEFKNNDTHASVIDCFININVFNVNLHRVNVVLLTKQILHIQEDELMVNILIFLISSLIL